MVFCDNLLKEVMGMIYELRIYTIHKGRMENIKNRFKDKAFALFKKHSMTIIDFWEDLIDDKIYYLVQHPDVETRNRNFEAFFKDPEWIEAKRISELDGPIVAKSESYLMSRVSFSPANKL